MTLVHNSLKRLARIQNPKDMQTVVCRTPMLVVGTTLVITPMVADCFVALETVCLIPSLL
jgi:hypothetical protein